MVARTIHAYRPLPEKEGGKAAAKAPPRKPDKQEPPRMTVPFFAKSGPKAQDIDTRTLARLRRGQMEIEATIDLHGHRMHEAYIALRDFVRGGYGRGLRCLLVIHGKGSLTGEAKIKNALSDWLAEWPDEVLSHAPAKPAHGGAGASYILLRRKRL